MALSGVVPEMMDWSARAADARKQARAWRMSALIDTIFHPGLANENSNKTEISHEYVHNIFDCCKSFMINH
jgi:hypothetical protein